MTNYEFETQYDRLLEFNKVYYAKAPVKDLIASLAKDFEAGFLRSLVNRVVADPFGKINVVEGLREEARARRRIHETRVMNQAFENLKREITDDGLKKALNGANNVWEAIMKNQGAK